MFKLFPLILMQQRYELFQDGENEICTSNDRDALQVSSIRWKHVYSAAIT
jgi:hypothetical protein